MTAALGAAEKPNVIFILSDDQGYGDLSCFGSKSIRTPNIDKLAAEGIRFTDFYSPYSVCSAARASILTGCYAPRISMRGVIWANATYGLHPDEVTLADMFKANGYATAAIGKWHVGDEAATLPLSQGFESYFGIPYSNDMNSDENWGTHGGDLNRIWAGRRWDVFHAELYRDYTVIESPVNQTTLTERYVAESIAFIQKNRQSPFFLYLANNMPHVPLFVPDDVYRSDPSLAYKLTVEHVDSCVGKLMAALDQLGLADNTLIIYTSDNGPWLMKGQFGGSPGPLRSGKGSTYEGGMRVPCVMRWPAGIQPGQVCRQVASSLDFLPTFAKLAGGELDESRPIDGLDISPLLWDSSAASPHDEAGFYYYNHNRLRAVRQGKWKLHLEPQGELYDLRADMGERRNLAARYPEKVRELKALAENYDASLRAHSRPSWDATEEKKATLAAKQKAVQMVTKVTPSQGLE